MAAFKPTDYLYHRLLIKSRHPEKKPCDEKLKLQLIISNVIKIHFFNKNNYRVELLICSTLVFIPVRNRMNNQVASKTMCRVARRWRIQECKSLYIKQQQTTNNQVASKTMCRLGRIYYAGELDEENKNAIVYISSNNNLIKMPHI